MSGGTFYAARYDSPVGRLTLAGTGEGLAGLWLEGQKYFGGSLVERLVPGGDQPVLAQARDWLDRYFAGARPDPRELPLAPVGGEFRQAVWKLLLDIPYGRTETYGELARRLAALRGLASMSAQAVGGAVGHNPISIVIPCHRVVGSGGSLTGYAGGVDKKRWLLSHEGVDVSGLTAPRRDT